MINLWVEVILCVWAVCKYVHRFIYIYIYPIFIYLVPLKDTLWGKLCTSSHCIYFPTFSLCSPLSHSAFPRAVPRVGCQTCDVIAGALESWRGRQGSSSTCSIFLCAQEELFNVSHGAGLWEQPLQSCSGAVARGWESLALRAACDRIYQSADLSRACGKGQGHWKAFQSTGGHKKCHCVVHAVLYGDTQAV